MYDRLKSAYLKKVRTEKGLKLTAVASLTHYSTAYISELERGKKTISNDEWYTLFSNLSINLPNDKFVEKILNSFDIVYNYIFLINTTKKSQEFEQLISIENDLLNSPLFLDFTLLKFIFYLDSHKIEEASIEFESLLKYETYFDEKQKYAFKVYSASYFILTNKLSESDLIFKEIFNNHIFIKPLSSMAHYYYSHFCLIKNDFLNGFHHVQIAKNLYLETKNPKRFSIALQLEANIYSEKRSFKQANQTYEILLDIVDVKDETMYNITFVNYSYNLIRQKYYEKAYLVLNNCTESYQYYPQYIFNKTLSLFFLSHHECLEYINNIDFSKCNHEYVNKFCLLIKLLIINENSAEIEHSLDYLLVKYSHELDYTAKEFILTQLLEYYRRTDNIKKQNKTLEALVALYKGEPHESL